MCNISLREVARIHRPSSCLQAVCLSGQREIVAEKLKKVNKKERPRSHVRIGAVGENIYGGCLRIGGVFRLSGLGPSAGPHVFTYHHTLQFVTAVWF